MDCWDEIDAALDASLYGVVGALLFLPKNPRRFDEVLLTGLSLDLKESFCFFLLAFFVFCGVTGGLPTGGVPTGASPA